MATPKLSREKARKISAKFLAGILGNGPGRCSGAPRGFAKDFWGEFPTKAREFVRQIPGKSSGNPGEYMGNPWGFGQNQASAWIPGKCPGRCLGVPQRFVPGDARVYLNDFPTIFRGRPGKSPDLHEFPGIAQGDARGPAFALRPQRTPCRLTPSRCTRASAIEPSCVSACLLALGSCALSLSLSLVCACEERTFGWAVRCGPCSR